MPSSSSAKTTVTRARRREEAKLVRRRNGIAPVYREAKLKGYMVLVAYVGASTSGAIAPLASSSIVTRHSVRASFGSINVAL